jgi:hypothetical protein
MSRRGFLMSEQPRGTTRREPSLHEDVPDSQANKTIEMTRAAVKKMAQIGENHEDLIRSAAGSLGIMEGGGGHMPQIPARRPPAAPQAAPVPAQVPAVPVPSALVYGDGNTVQEGDIVQDQKTQMLAEVKTVAGNGVVLDIPAVGVQVVQPNDLLGYKRMGQKRRGQG